MPALVATVSQACQNGAGLLTLSALSNPAPAGQDIEYTWAVVNAAGVDFGDSFDPVNLPAHTSGLPNGDYTSVVQATNNNTTVVYSSAPRYFTISCGPPLALSFATATAAQATTGGTVSLGASGGAAPLVATLPALNLSQQLMPGAGGQLQTTFANIPAGSYTVQVKDSASPAQLVQTTVTVAAYVPAAVLGCTDPTATNYDPSATQDDGSCTYPPAVRPAAYFEVPAMQSLRFVQPGRPDKPTFDNVLLADETPLDYTNPGYCQKVEQGDTLVLQCLSNYEGLPVLTLYSGTQAVKSVTGIRVQQGAGTTAAFEVYAKADPVAGRTRLYFSADVLPLPFEPGQRITLSATGTALDGTYPIRDVLEDPAAAVPYLTITATYPSANIRLDGTLATTYVVQVYDTYQFVLPFLAVPRGCYQARITALDADYGSALAVSEPVDVAPAWPGTKLIQYRNFDNDFDLDYSHGLVNRQRIVCRFFTRRPTGEKIVLRDDDNELVLLRADVYRKVELETLLLPGWLHEVLFVAFSHDWVKVDGLEVVLEGDYTHEPVERYTLGKGEALLEAKGFLGAGNRDDLGDVDAGGGPFLVAQSKFLQVNP